LLSGTTEANLKNLRQNPLHLSSQLNYEPRFKTKCEWVLGATALEFVKAIALDQKNLTILSNSVSSDCFNNQWENS